MQREISRLRELVGILRAPGRSRENFSEASIERAAREILKSFPSNISIKELAPELRRFYSFIATAEEMNEENLEKRAMEVAEKIFARLKPNEANLDAGDEILLKALLMIA